MPKKPALPTAKQIVGLTDENVRSVALCYLNMLKRGKSNPNALDFIVAAVEHLRYRSNVHKDIAIEREDTVGRLIQRLPHCRIDLAYEADMILTNEQFLDWCETSDITFETVHHSGEIVYIFPSEEERILFKLRWL